MMIRNCHKCGDRLGESFMNGIVYHCDNYDCVRYKLVVVV